MFLKKNNFTTTLSISELESRFTQYFKSKWTGQAYLKNQNFLMKPEFRGIFFQVYAEGHFIKNGNSTTVEVEYKVGSIVRVMTILSFIFTPILYIILKVFNAFILGPDMDVFLLIAPLFSALVSFSTFYREYNDLRKIVNSICGIKA